MRHTYEVVVGNVGSVYSGQDMASGLRKFSDYVNASKAEVGRAGGESVTLLCDGEIIKEYVGTIDADGRYVG